jgi:hypothetical protein
LQEYDQKHPEGRKRKEDRKKRSKEERPPVGTLYIVKVNFHILVRESTIRERMILNTLSPSLHKTLDFLPNCPLTNPVLIVSH